MPRLRPFVLFIGNNIIHDNDIWYDVHIESISNQY